jgi:hypothetical protein
VVIVVVVILLMPMGRGGYYLFSDIDSEDFGDANDERN